MIIGAEKLQHQLHNLSSLDVREAVGEAVKLVQGQAKLLCPVRDGELRDSIYSNIQDSFGLTTGTCYTDKSYAAFVEFGTGPAGQANHAGISPEASPSYSQEPWWIHEDQIDRSTAEYYGWPYIDTQQGRFYRCSGQAAHPFLYPALKNNEENIKKLFAEKVSAQVRRSIE